ncbi:glycine cleavage system protein H [Vagococcus sp. BWB3-3]|uniref:Glycine cleavage system protein H n=1 Tax=Vagococcus allomyrinae TaxID=2794353 RepID=A0A940PGG3_9ENTE|nr:glycine cleavage system protein H [Vagococcus allomyrinae]MBP1043101.1 glycine cleavage system protein H [Vagococcus allomyrinae]
MKKIVNKQIWVTKEGDSLSIGLTNEGQDDFGSVSFVSLPKIGDRLTVGDSFAEIEAEKAVTELVTPVSGTVASINQEALADASSLDVKNENFAWMIVLTDIDEKEFDNLV